MSTISTHILDTSKGMPASGVELRLEKITDGNKTVLAKGTTNSDGRMPEMKDQVPTIEVGQYCMRFEVAKYLEGEGQKAFYPFVEVFFEVTEKDSHYHIPLLLSPFGYSTYRGS